MRGAELRVLGRARWPPAVEPRGRVEIEQHVCLCFSPEDPIFSERGAGRVVRPELKEWQEKLHATGYCGAIRYTCPKLMDAVGAVSTLLCLNI